MHKGGRRKGVGRKKGRRKEKRDGGLKEIQKIKINSKQLNL